VVWREQSFLFPRGIGWGPFHNCCERKLCKDVSSSPRMKEEEFPQAQGFSPLPLSCRGMWRSSYRVRSRGPAHLFFLSPEKAIVPPFPKRRDQVQKAYLSFPFPPPLGGRKRALAFSLHVLQVRTGVPIPLFSLSPPT